MKFMRRTADYTKWDHKRNEEIVDNVKTKAETGYIQNHQRKRNM